MALKRALDPGLKGIHASQSECALREHNLLRPPLFENPGSAPGSCPTN